ncbi:MAG: DUF4157 domain-containing protein, partial [Kovacikia sp.]
MNWRSLTQTQAKSSFTPVQTGLLQRKCTSCGQHTIAGSECSECTKKKSSLQRKLTIGASNDPLEREADRVADQVLAAPAHTAVSNAPPRIQRFTRQTAGQADMEAPASVDRVLASPGLPLDAATRDFMEPRFARDFSQIRIHANPTAARSATEIDARAYTVGNNVVFAPGEFAPSTPRGRELLAHELVHTVQQAGTAGTIQRRPAVSPNKKIPKPQIVKIVAFEGDQKRGVAYVNYPALPDLGQEAATVPEAVTITENNLAPGKYTMRRGEQHPERYEGLPTAPPGKEKPGFRWLNPYVDKKTQELKYDWAEFVEIAILPYSLRDFLEKDRGAKATAGDVTSEIRAAEILVKSGITEDDLRREEHRANDYFLKTEEVDPVLWAESLA